MFGFVIGFEEEWGYFSLNELERIHAHGLAVERDIYFEPGKFADEARPGLCVNRIRAVLVESLNDRWTNKLRVGARHAIVSGGKPSPLFWFTPSEVVFEKPITVKIKGAEKQISVFLEKPELVFGKIWATPADDDEQPTFQSLID